MRRLANLGLLAAALSLASAACDRGNVSRSAAAPPAPPPLTLVLPESGQWSRQEAAEKLAEPESALSAAVRIVDLAYGGAACVPPELTDSTAARLRLLSLGPDWWALGIREPEQERMLRAPVLIDSGGAVRRFAEGLEEELLTLHVSPDPDVFPHVVVSPLHVWTIDDPDGPALSRDYPDTVGFAWRPESTYGYIALMLSTAEAADGGLNEIAEYRWEPYELAFAGPAADNLPDPPGGKFALDMAGSPLLIPVGGEIPEPKPLPKEPALPKRSENYQV